MTRILLFCLFCLTKPAHGQIKQSEREFQNYSEQVHTYKVDTIIVIKAGCTGCDVVYKDNSKRITDGQTIYVLTKQNNRFQLATFDDLDTAKLFLIDTCSLFHLISNNKFVLLQKESFYKKEIPKIKSKSGFYPPGAIHYSYEDVSIRLHDFTYNFEIVDNTKDRFGIRREKENWFIVTKKILQQVYSYSKNY